MKQSFMGAIFNGPKDIATAQKIVNVTVCMSLFIAVLAAAISVVGFYKISSDKTIQYLFDSWSFVDVFFIFVFTFFLYKRKLWAAICLVVHLILSLVIIYIDLNKLPGVIAMCKLALFLSAIRAIHFINKEGINSGVKNA
jgi:hypothetical protein